jgi:carbon starvation protein CstA
MFQPTRKCCSVTILRPLPARAAGWPVLAAQMGYLPGMIWILAGVVLAGAVQDFMVLFVSTRRDGRSLGELVKEEMGRPPGCWRWWPAL